MVEVHEPWTGQMRFARGSGCDWIRYDRPAAAAIGADKYAQFGASRDEDVGILRVEGNQGRLRIAAKSGKGRGTPPVLVNERTSTGHRAVEADVVVQVVPLSVENIILGPVGVRFEA